MKLSKKLVELIFTLVFVLLPARILAQDNVGQHALLEHLQHIPIIELNEIQQPTLSYIDFKTLLGVYDLTAPETFDVFRNETLTEDESIVWKLISGQRANVYAASRLFSHELTGLSDTMGFSILDVDSNLIIGSYTRASLMSLIGDFDTGNIISAIEANAFEEIQLSGEDVWTDANTDVMVFSGFGNPFRFLLTHPIYLSLQPNRIIGTEYEELAERLMAHHPNLEEFTLLEREDEVKAIIEILINTDADLIQLELYNSSITQEFDTQYFSTSPTNLGILPAYSYVALADYQLDGRVIHSIAMSYDTASDANPAVTEVVKRLATYDYDDLYSDFEFTFLEPQVIDYDGIYVVLVSISYPAPTRQDILDGDVRIMFNHWVRYYSTFFPIWVNE